jgi:hypothetical protein
LGGIEGRKSSKFSCSTWKVLPSLSNLLQIVFTSLTSTTAISNHYTEIYLTILPPLTTLHLHIPRVSKLVYENFVCFLDRDFPGLHRYPFYENLRRKPSFSESRRFPRCSVSISFAHAQHLDAQSSPPGISHIRYRSSTTLVSTVHISRIHPLTHTKYHQFQLHCRRYPALASEH